MERKFTETQVNQIVKDAVAPLQAEIERLKSERDPEPDGSRKELMEEVQRLSQQNQELSAIESAHQQVEASLQAALADTQRKTLENDALIRASRAVLRHKRFPEAAKTIFECCKEMTGATAGYVALLSEDGSENEVLFLDSGGRKCTVDPNLPMPIRGLRATAYHQAMTVYDNDFWNSHWKQFLPGGHVPLDNVMFAPLTIDNQVVGLIGLGNKNGPFTENDSRMATAFGELAAIALKNSRALEALDLKQAKGFC